MPERPDLDYVVPRLDKALRGQTIRGATVRKPVVLRVAVEGKFEELVAGKTIGPVTRRSHMVIFPLPPYEMVIAPMLAGRFALTEPGAKAPADLAVAFDLGDQVLRYRDDVQMGKVYIIPAGQWDLVPGMPLKGLDVLDPKVFTKEAFRALAKKRRDQVKVFLMDKSALDSFGNAYADETLFAAGLHPKTMVSRLAPHDVDALHDACVRVLKEASKEIEKRKPPLDEKVRDFLKVRGRKGEPCKKCGTKIRSAGVRGHDAEFCPTCQPATRKSAIVDWRRIP